jgi:sensor histidine kinase YesM
MRWHEFIFSNSPQHRNRRRLLCWLLWWIYIVFTIFFTPEPRPPRNPNGLADFNHHQPGLLQLGYLQYSILVSIKSILLLLTHLLFCYSVIYILLPNFLLKKGYTSLVIGVLAACTIMVTAGYFLYAIIYSFVDRLFHLSVIKTNTTIVWASIDAGLLNGIKLTLVAVAIILLKRWWLKQKEKELLEKEKINAQLQLLKAQVHPAFLFSTLNNIITHAQKASPKAPEMLIKLSDLLSYMLYECDEPKVKLEKEISMLQDYMALEKIRQGERLEMTFQLNGPLNGQLISPLLLLPFVDNSLSYCNNEALEKAWVNLDITIEGNNLSMKLLNGLPPVSAGESPDDEQRFADVQKRLQLLYPGQHELKINAEQELMMVHLNLKLEEAREEDQITITATKPVLSYAGA